MGPLVEQYDPVPIIAAVRMKAPKRAKVYDYIVAEVKAGRGFPTARQIDGHFKWRNTACYMLPALVAEGLLLRFYRDTGISKLCYGLIERAVVQRLQD